MELIGGVLGHRGFVDFSLFFFFNDTATTEIYTLSLHDALPIWDRRQTPEPAGRSRSAAEPRRRPEDRKSTRLNSSHVRISYAVFCLKKKKELSEGIKSQRRQDRFIGF